MEEKPTQTKIFKIIIALLAVILIVCVVSLGFLWRKLGILEAEAPLSPEAELAQVIAEVGNSLALPGDEQPKLLTLSDEELIAVKGEPFFANALPGDKLLIYQNNSKAVIWRPSSRKIIEASIINLSGATQ